MRKTTKKRKLNTKTVLFVLFALLVVAFSTLLPRYILQQREEEVLNRSYPIEDRGGTLDYLYTNQTMDSIRRYWRRYDDKYAGYESGIVEGREEEAKNFLVTTLNTLFSGTLPDNRLTEEIYEVCYYAMETTPPYILESNTQSGRFEEISYSTYFDNINGNSYFTVSLAREQDTDTAFSFSISASSNIFPSGESAYTFEELRRIFDSYLSSIGLKELQDWQYEEGYAPPWPEEKDSGTYWCMATSAYVNAAVLLQYYPDSFLLSVGTYEIDGYALEFRQEMEARGEEAMWETSIN